MLSFETRRITRIITYVFAVLILGSSLWYSNYLARQLEEKEQKRAQLYADALSFNVTLNLRDTTAKYKALGFIQEKLVNQYDKQVPRILVGEDNTIDDYLLEIEEDLPDDQKQELLANWRKKLAAENEPIKMEYFAGRTVQVYYGDTQLLKQLRWFPFMQLLVAFAFIGIVFGGFVVAKRNEQNRVWVGLAKETAHQLGTPVQSLMSWIELMKMRLESRREDLELAEHMEQDIMRLENITERFSKIGSQPELSEVSLKSVLDRSAHYIRKRMTKSIELDIQNQLPADSHLWINPPLFDWVIENLLKNALDAINQKEGKITLHAGQKGKFYFIDVSDTGKGIPKGNFKKVFEPGFTTKKRGWGLGLSLTRRIVENYHQGRIFVKESELGKGTTFRILLPVTNKRANSRLP